MSSYPFPAGGAFTVEYLDEAVRTYEGSVVGYARKRDRLQRVWLLSDKKSGKVYSISVWETEEDILAGEGSGYLRDRFAKLAGFFAKQPVTERFEVAVKG